MTIDDLAAYGANVEEGLKRCMGMTDFYVQLAGSIKTEQGFDKLNEEINAGDLDAARKAGIPFIYAAYGFGQVDAEKEKVPSIEAFSQLPGAVTALWEKAGNRR